jgi:hypothetical protein
MYRNLEYSEKLVSFSFRKRRGDVTRIFNTFSDVSLSHISNVLAGRRFNENIVNAAYRLSYRRMKNSTLA